MLVLEDGLSWDIYLLLNQKAFLNRNDPDFLMTGGAGCDDLSGSHCPGQTDTEYKTEFSIWLWEIDMCM